jgi:hypothetical protein
MADPNRATGGSSAPLDDPSGGRLPQPPRAFRRAESIRRRRAERLGLRERQRRERLRTRIGVGALAVLAVGGLAFGAYTTLQEQRLRQPPAGVETTQDLARDHVEGDVAYQSIPPVGGEHAPIWQNCGFYDAPVAEETAVHSLEHGAVWITYRPDLDAAQKARLAELAGQQSYVLVSAFPGLPSPVVASAWNHQLVLESADDPRLTEFVAMLQKGSEAPEPGAPCSGGSSDLAAVFAPTLASVAEGVARRP